MKLEEVETMKKQKEESRSFSLRIPISMWARAAELARLEEISLNRFILLAIAENFTRRERQAVRFQTSLFPVKQ